MFDRPPQLDDVLGALGIDPDDLLGEGGEALVYGLDADRVARVNRSSSDTLDARNALLRELHQSASAVPFAVPEVLETHRLAGLDVTIERRLPGRDLAEVLVGREGPRRVALIEAYLNAAACIGDLRAERDWYGDLIGAAPIRRPSWHAYLEARAATGLEHAGWLDAPTSTGRLSPTDLAAALPEPDEPALVHLDAFPGNMLAGDDTITAVIDFSVVSVIGDRRLDPLAAVAYLDPEITPAATDADRSQAIRWLEARDLSELLTPARRWLAAFWSSAMEDPRLASWCSRILEVPRP